jgi:hypothetical protein
MIRKDFLLILVVFASLLIVSCNNNSSDKKTETNTENEEKVEVKFLEDFASFEDSEMVAEHFGEENILNDTWSIAEGTETYLVTIVNPECKNQMIIYWDKASKDYKDFAFVEARYSEWDIMGEELTNEGTTYPSKSGVKVGMTLTELEKLNAKPITFFGFGWDYGGMVTNASDKFQGLAISLFCPTEEDSQEWVDAYMNVVGDSEFTSDDEAAKAIPIFVGSISYHGE